MERRVLPDLLDLLVRMELMVLLDHKDRLD